MHIISNSSERLFLEHRPFLVPALAMSLVIGVVIQAVNSAPSLSFGEWVATGAGVLIGCIIAYLSALPSRVEFDANRCEIRWDHVGWPGRERGSLPLDQVTGIKVLADEIGAKRLAITTSTDVVPLTRHFTAFERHEQNAATIGEWLEQHRQGKSLNESFKPTSQSGAV